MFVRSTNMNITRTVRRSHIKILILLLSLIGYGCYEKTLRKIVRNQSKMVQRPFSDNADLYWKNNSRPHPSAYPGYTQISSVLHKMPRNKISTILSSVDTGRSKSMFSTMNIVKNDILHPYELRMARDALTDVLRQNLDNSIRAISSTRDNLNVSGLDDTGTKISHFSPTSIFFPPVHEKLPQNMEPETSVHNNNSITILDDSIMNEDKALLVKNIVVSSTEVTTNSEDKDNALMNNLTVSEYYDTDFVKTNFFVEKASTKVALKNNQVNNSLILPVICTRLSEAKVDIDAQEKFKDFDIEPSWIENKQFWNQIYDSRYEALMRNPKWPALKVILVPRTHVDTIWKEPFDTLHKNTVRKIIANIVKKLQFYSNLTFSWNEVSHLSQWWKSARQKSRTALRKLVEEGRLEITTGGWVETEEATSHIFGILHQLTEGHQWLQYHLNFSPDVAWLTNSVTHSPTLPYLLSASGISRLILTNLHFSWQQYLTEYQYTDFVWIQNWDTDKSVHTNLNEAGNRFGNDRYPKHSVLAHYLQFNSAGYKACGPQGYICDTEFNFVDSAHNQDINTFNVKEKSEKMLEQYSKTGTTSSHNTIISPLGDAYSYETQTEFDFQYNNYQKIADFVNINQNIYKASIEFGTSKDYFENILMIHNNFPTLKGDFLNFADIKDSSPAYWTGFFTTRPLFKILLRRLQSTLRSTEILFSFALNFNVFKSYKVSKLFERLLNARESVARLQDRNVVGGTITAKALKFAQQQILNTVRDCWYIQEIAASLLSIKPNLNETYLEKYIYREGEFISSFKSVTPGDQIYVFNSLNHNRIEIVELISRNPNIKIVDHLKNEVPIQINPIWKFGFEKVVRISSNFFKILFAIDVPPLAFALFKITESSENPKRFATIYCTSCVVGEIDSGPTFPFNIRPLETGDIQLDNYRHRLIFDEFTGFLKSVHQKSNKNEKNIVVEFGAFTSANVQSGMFLFKTNISNPLEDILLPFRLNPQSRAIIIVSGQITTELSSLYGNLLHHAVKIFNLMNNPLSDIIKLETKVDYDAVSKNREIEIFLSIQTDIQNGNHPEFVIDNNGFQYTSRTINVSRPVESNIYPFTSMAFIQDHRTRLTVVTDYAQGMTVLQEGQLVLMLDRRVLFDDARGSNEGIADNSITCHTHYLLLENFVEPKDNNDEMLSSTYLKLPSQTAIYLSNNLNYHLDVYFIDVNNTHLCHYAFLPLIKTSFPCDIALINYRVVLNRGIPENYIPNTAVMTLHRQSFSCRIAIGNDLHCHKDYPLALDGIFHNIRAVYKTNLVGTSEGVPVNVLTKNNFPPMELMTLRMYF